MYTPSLVRKEEEDLFSVLPHIRTMSSSSDIKRIWTWKETAAMRASKTSCTFFVCVCLTLKWKASSNEELQLWAEAVTPGSRDKRLSAWQPLLHTGLTRFFGAANVSLLWLKSQQIFKRGGRSDQKMPEIEECYATKTLTVVNSGPPARHRNNKNNERVQNGEDANGTERKLDLLLDKSLIISHFVMVVHRDYNTLNVQTSF